MKKENNNHKQIGKDLFFHHPLSPGNAFYSQDGAYIYHQMEKWFYEMHFQHDYQIVKSPAIYKQDLYQQSGHMQSFAENMFHWDQWAIKPMNCPGHILIYKQKPRAHSHLPMRLCEIGQVHRKEQSGNLNGLFRCCGFSIDDAHLFVSEEDLDKEIDHVLHMAQMVYDKLGFGFVAKLSLRPHKMIGKADLWDKAEKILRESLCKANIAFVESPGEGAFYGPKIDLHCKDSLGRMWQMGSVQLDFQMPERFDLEYFDKDNKKQRPVMIHRALFGSLERMLGILLENHKGKLPFWLHPKPIAILPVASAHMAYACEIKEALKNMMIPAYILSQQSLGKRIAQSQHENLIQVIVGNQEVKQRKIQKRLSGEKSSSLQDLSEFYREIEHLMKNRM